jgi:hypothetical protein
MSKMGGWATPGIGADRTVAETEILWGADQARSAALWTSAVISGAARDAGNTPTTVLRPGLLMGKVTSSGEFKEWNPDGTDGSENLWGVLDTELRAQDFDATDQDRVFRLLVARAPLKARKLLIEGTALVGDTDEYLARRMLAKAGFVLDDDPGNYLSGLNQRISRVTGVTDAVTAAENGSLLIYSNAASVTVTLPTIVPGLSFDLLREGDEEFIVTSAEGDNVIVGNDLAADSITFTTAGNHIGAMVHVESIYVNGTPLWLLTLPNVPIGTGVNTLPFGLGT